MSHEYDPNDLALMQWYDGELTDAPELSGDLEAKRETMELVGAMLRVSIEDDARGAGIADAVMGRLDEAPQPAEVLELPQGTKPVNDNARIIYGLAGLAAAAAVGLFFWGSNTPSQEPTVAQAPVASEAPAELTADDAPRPPEAHPADLPPLTAQVDAEEEAQPAVEVASVDFGRHQGSVFYVGGQNAQTAVVWVNDEDEL